MIAPPKDAARVAPPLRTMRACDLDAVQAIERRACEQLPGGVAAAVLVLAVPGEQTPVGRMRGRVYALPGAEIPVVVTYHPAYLLRAPQQKRAAWDDLQLACRTVGRELP